MLKPKLLKELVDYFIMTQNCSSTYRDFSIWTILFWHDNSCP